MCRDRRVLDGGCDPVSGEGWAFARSCPIVHHTICSITKLRAALLLGAVFGMDGLEILAGLTVAPYLRGI